jgi:hypothetical protein
MEMKALAGRLCWLNEKDAIPAYLAEGWRKRQVSAPGGSALI